MSKMKQILSPAAQAFADQQAETPHDPETGEVLPEADDQDADEPDTDDDNADHGLNLETLSGDLRDVLLTRFRQMQKPWAQMTEMEQSDFANGMDQAARNLVRQTVRLFTGYEWPRVVVTLGEVKIIGGDKSRIEGKIVCPNIADYRDVLGEHAGTQVMLLAVDSATFMAERAPVAIDPDQPDLPEQDDDQDDEADQDEAA